jgi:hypothetical protein
MMATLGPPRPATALAGTRTPPVAHRPAPGRRHGPRTADEKIIGVALTTRWMLITGRRLHQSPLLHDLPTGQLIDFWADDHQPQPCR